jgi:hypothetical protein
LRSLQRHKQKIGVSHITNWRMSTLPINLLKYLFFILNYKNSIQTHKFLSQYTSVSGGGSKEEWKNTANRTANIVVHVPIHTHTHMKHEAVGCDFAESILWNTIYLKVHSCTYMYVRNKQPCPQGFCCKQFTLHKILPWKAKSRLQPVDSATKYTSALQDEHHQCCTNYIKKFTHSSWSLEMSINTTADF